MAEQNEADTSLTSNDLHPHIPGHKNRKSGVVVRGKSQIANLEKRKKWMMDQFEITNNKNEG